MTADLELTAAELVSEHRGDVQYLQDCGFERGPTSAVACDQPVRGHRTLNGQPVPACAHHLAAGGRLNHHALHAHHDRTDGYEVGSWAASMFVAKALRAADIDAVDITAGNGRGWVAFGEPEGTHHPFRLDLLYVGAIVRDYVGDPVGAVSGDLAAVVALAVEVAMIGAES